MIQMNLIGNPLIFVISTLNLGACIFDFYFFNKRIQCFPRWEAGQVLARKLMLSLVVDFQQNKSLSLNPKFIEGIRCILCNTSLDKVKKRLILLELIIFPTPGPCTITYIWI